MIGRLANALGYQCVWFASVTGAGHGLPWAGPVAASAFATLMLAFGGQRRADVRVIPLALAVGAAADSAWIALGWLDYRASWPSAAFAPAWILGLWLSLALTLNHSLAFLKGRPVSAALLGAIGGPSAYWAAAKLGSVRFDAPALTVLGGLCLAWAVIFPALMHAADRHPAVAVAADPRQVHP